MKQRLFTRRLASSFGTLMGVLALTSGPAPVLGAMDPECGPDDPVDRITDHPTNSLLSGRQTMSANGKWLTYISQNDADQEKPNVREPYTIEVGDDNHTENWVSEFPSGLYTPQPNDPNGVFDMSVSADHRIVAFAFVNGNLTPTYHYLIGDFNHGIVGNSLEAFHESNTNTPLRVALSGDGRKIVLSNHHSPDTGDVADPPFGEMDIFVGDVDDSGLNPSVSNWARVNGDGSGTRVKIAEQGDLALSHDGRYVVFWSMTGTQNNIPTLQRKDLASGDLDEVYEGLAPPAGQILNDFAMSGNGQFIVFPDSSPDAEIYFRDFADGSQTAAEPLKLWNHSLSALDNIGLGGGAHRLSVSASGRFVAFSYGTISLFTNDTSLAIYDRDSTPGTNQKVASIAAVNRRDFLIQHLERIKKSRLLTAAIWTRRHSTAL